jgi:hypothetical protein
MEQKPKSRFVRPDFDILKISNGDTLTVKRRLTNGELREQLDHAYTWINGERKFDALTSGLALCVAYLIDWSVTDDQGDLVLLRDPLNGERLPWHLFAAKLDALDPDDFKEIKEAIEKHEAKMDAERAAEKNGQGGGKNAPTISPSPDGAVGLSSTSAP